MNTGSPSTLPVFLCYALERKCHLYIWWRYNTERACHALDKNGETRSVALDNSKAFTKVLIFIWSWRIMVFPIKFDSIIQSFLSNRKLIVILNGQSSRSFYICSGVAQGFIIGCTLFIIKNCLTLSYW